MDRSLALASLVLLAARHAAASHLGPHTHVMPEFTVQLVLFIVLTFCVLLCLFAVFVPRRVDRDY